MAEKPVEQLVELLHWQQDLDDRGDEQPVLVGGLDEDAGPFERIDGVLGPALVARGVGGVRGTELRNAFE